LYCSLFLIGEIVLETDEGDHARRFFEGN